MSTSAVSTRPPSISVAIASLKRADLLRRTLDALASDARAWSAGVQAIVVSDGEDEATRELARTYTAGGLEVEWLFHDQNLGLAAARNSGAERATGDFLLFLDDDSEIAPGFLHDHVNVHLEAEKQDPRFRYVACGRIVESAPVRQTSPTGDFLERAWSSTLERYEAAMRVGETDPDLSNALEISCFGLNCSMRRELFAATGGFQTLLRWMSQDLEYGVRLFMRGVRFLFTPATVLHRNDKDLAAYFTRCWSVGGACDSLRAVVLRQHDAQTRNLLNLDTGPKLDQMTNRLFWHAHQQGLEIANSLRKVTDRTGSRLAFRLWHDTERLSRYWAAVQQVGISREQLRHFAAAPLRVLMLHSISKPENARESRYYLSPRRFRLLLERMRDGGFHCADPKKLEDPNAECFRGELVLTFDDGYDDFYTEVFPLITEHGLKPLLFLPVDWIGKSNSWEAYKPRRNRDLLTLPQIREMHRHGVRFGSHSLTHPVLPALNPNDLWREVSESKHRLEDLLGEPINTFAYPFGEANRRVRAAVIEAGYKAAFTTTEGLNIWQDPFALKRIDMNDQVGPWSYSLKLRTGLSARENLKQELTPLARIIPRELRAPLVHAWRSRRRRLNG